MPTGERFARVKLMDIRHQIEREVGFPKAEKYFYNLRRFVNREIGPLELSKSATDIFGKGKSHLHNHLLRSILKNATCSTSPPKTNKLKALNTPTSARIPNGHQRTIPPKLRHPNLVHGKNGFREQQNATELLSLGERPPVSEEDGEEVEQASDSPGILSRTPITAPLGIIIPATKRKAKRKYQCSNELELLDTPSLKKALEGKLEAEGLKVSVDCINLLNNSVDVFLKRLIKQCLELARSRPRAGHNVASVLDFRVAMELNPTALGEDWPSQLEKICLRALQGTRE